MDVDNLEGGAGADYIDESHFILAFNTRRYLASKACARELIRAQVKHKPVIAVLEPECTEEKGGLTVDECRRIIVDSRYSGSNWCRSFGLEPELNEWAAMWRREVRMPTPLEVYNMIFDQPPIEWNRFSIFQDVTMRLIAERLLSAGEHDRATLFLPPLRSSPSHRRSRPHPASYFGRASGGLCAG